MLQPIRSASSLHTSSSLRHPSGAGAPDGGAAPGPRGWSACPPPRPTAAPAARRRRWPRSRTARSPTTTSRSRAARRSATTRASGAETTGLEPCTSSTRGPPSVPSADEQLEGAAAGTRQVGGVDAPDRGDVRPRGRVVDLAVAGQLVGLLAVLAAALAVALTGDRAEAGAGVAGQPEREGEGDEGRHRVGAARVLLGAAGRQDVGAALGVAGASQRRHGRAHRRDGDARDALDPLGQPLRRDRPEVVEARGALAR